MKVNQARRSAGFAIRPLGSVGLILLVVILSIATVGVPATLLVIGVWSFSAVIGRHFKALTGMASWAAGFVIEITWLAAESFAAGLLRPHAHSQYVYVTFLILPILGASALYIVVALVGRKEDHSNRVSGEPWLALFLVVIVDAMFEIIKLRGQDYGLSWAMTGDARNHVVINDGILYAGGITLKGLKSYPAMVNALTAILDGAGGRQNLAAGTLMTRDIQAMAATMVISCSAVACFFIAALGEALPKLAGRVQRISTKFYIPLIGCATLALGAYILGLTESGGFLTAIGSLAIVMASIVLGLRMIRIPNSFTLFLLTITVFLVVASWTVLVVIPATLVIVGTSFFLIRTVRPTENVDRRGLVLNWLAIAAAAACLLGISVELYLNRVVLVSRLQGYGGIVPPNPGFTVWLGVFCVAVLAIAPNRQQRLLRFLMLCVYASGCAAALWLRHIEPKGVSWSYYSTKMLWLATSSAIWIPFILVTDAIQWIDKSQRLGEMRKWISVSVSVALVSVMVWFSTYETPVLVPFTSSYVGDTYPTPSVVALVIKEANMGGPFVLWNYSQNEPGQSFNQFNDVLGNFWAAMAWDFTPSGNPLPWKGLPTSFYEWGYVENGTISALCQVITRQTIRIVTSDTKLRGALLSSCPVYRARSKVDVIDIEPALKTYTNPL